MAKFNIGSKVVLISEKQSATYKEWFGKNIFEVAKIIPDNAPIGNGETNKSGEDIIRCMLGAVAFNFRESELKLAE